MCACVSISSTNAHPFLFLFLLLSFFKLDSFKYVFIIDSFSIYIPYYVLALTREQPCGLRGVV